MSTATLRGSWKYPELVSDDPPSRRAVPRDDGLYDVPLHLIDRYSKVDNGDFIERRGRRIGKPKNYAYPLGFFVDGTIRVAGRLRGLEDIEEVLGSLPRDEYGRAILTPQQGVLATQYVNMSKQARSALAEVPIPEWFGLNLYRYQVEGAHGLVSGRPFAADEPGLGKTRQLLAAMAIADVDRLLVVCPPVAITSWSKEASASKVACRDRYENAVVYSDVSDVEVLADVKPIIPTRKMPKVPRHRGVVIVSSSLLAARPQLLRMITAWNPNGLIIDESHQYRNGDTQRTKILSKMADGIHGLVLEASGTPFYANPMELSAQLRICRRMEVPFGGYPSFEKRYFSQMPWGEYRPRAKTLPQLHKVLNEQVWVRRLKADVLSDLPDKVRLAKIVDVDLKLYRQAHKDVIEKIDQWLDRVGPSLKTMTEEEQDEALWEFSRQSLPFISKLRVAAGLCKVDVAKELVTDWINTYPDEPIILWVHHKEVASAMLKAAQQAVGTENVAAIMGETSATKRGQVVSDFQNGKVKVLVASITAAGVAITLTRCHQSFFIETDWTPALVIQAEDRTHRIGQIVPPTYTTLIAPDTLDESIQNIHKKKAENLNPVLGGDSDVSVTDTFTDPAAVILHNIVEKELKKWLSRKPRKTQSKPLELVPAR